MVPQADSWGNGCFCTYLINIPVVYCMYIVIVLMAKSDLWMRDQRECNSCEYLRLETVYFPATDLSMPLFSSNSSTFFRKVVFNNPVDNILPKLLLTYYTRLLPKSFMDCVYIFETQLGQNESKKKLIKFETNKYVF